MKRKLVHALWIVACFALLFHYSVIRSVAQETGGSDRIVQLSASRFEFDPGEIVVKKGEHVTLELISQDRHHGFKLPEWNLRADIRPGIVEDSIHPGQSRTVHLLLRCFLW